MYCHDSSFTILSGIPTLGFSRVAAEVIPGILRRILTNNLPRVSEIFFGDLFRYFTNNYLRKSCKDCFGLLLSQFRSRNFI